jgi:two-component system response regulator YesN
MGVTTMYQLLLVDDEHTVVDNLAVSIPWNELGIETVHKAYSGYEALEILRHHPVHIVITDIRMPGMSGMQLLKEINLHWKRIRCLLLSGYSEFEYAQEAIQYHTFDYLLKPISNDDLFKAVEKLISVLQEEWEQVASYQNAQQLLKDSLPLLRRNLLNDLLQGKQLPAEVLEEKVKLVGLPVVIGQHFTFMLVRLEEGFRNYSDLNHPLLEFALCNLVNEIFADVFEVCYCRDVHDYLIFLVMTKGDEEDTQQELLAELARQLQLSVTTFLKGRISLLVGGRGMFPKDLDGLYQSALSVFRKRVGNANDFFVTAMDGQEKASLHALQRLYEPPGLIHLLEAGRWETVEDRFGHIFAELARKEYVSQEHLLEVYTVILNAYICISHKNNKYLFEILRTDVRNTTGTEHFQSIGQLKEWSYSTLQQIKEDMSREAKGNRLQIIQQVKEFVFNHLEADISLQLIADQVYLHPVYLSKIYKSETGENLSDYLLRLRMERADHLLSDNQYKIHEIANQLGYHNTSHFIKIFKKYYQMTPQEYRNKTSMDSQID